VKWGKGELDSSFNAGKWKKEGAMKKKNKEDSEEEKRKLWKSTDRTVPQV